MELIESIIKSIPIKIIGGSSSLIPHVLLLLYSVGLIEFSSQGLVIVVIIAMLSSIGLMKIKFRIRIRDTDPVCQNCKKN